MFLKVNEKSTNGLNGAGDWINDGTDVAAPNLGMCIMVKWTEKETRKEMDKQQNERLKYGEKSV
jgi:hypothetical protein